jgi:hypothetical protein
MTLANEMKRSNNINTQSMVAPVISATPLMNICPSILFVFYYNYNGSSMKKKAPYSMVSKFSDIKDALIDLLNASNKQIKQH